MSYFDWIICLSISRRSMEYLPLAMLAFHPCSFEIIDECIHLGGLEVLPRAQNSPPNLAQYFV